MTVDDDRDRWRDTLRTGLRRRIAGFAVAGLLLVIGVGASLLWGDAFPDAGDALPERLAATAALGVGLLLLGWAGYAAVRAYVTHWRAVMEAEIVPATIVETYYVGDGEGGYRWDVRVAGSARSGAVSFNRRVYFGHDDPGPVGSSITVRYHAGLRRISTVDRGVLAVVTSVIGHLLALGGVGLLFYSLWRVAVLIAGLWP
ncbi:hypothetical protein ACFQY4_24195 [Catellatospora bangladeshensis]|uniref:DUF3592 domain-containing protein n=1 Tax=Catellatospora bangladeshensis TaxID=310355 RepID=A0A8J3JLI1_9ACTN|nr:hypothetical protein [Catellatospora bangladeshensis]GIF80134.1 hypothetical protein Cba03nite_14830 [Catellatospora bangladeshensis]